PQTRPPGLLLPLQGEALKRCPLRDAARAASAVRPSSPATPWERLRPRALAVAPPPAKAGGGWEGVPTVRADPEDTPPGPSPAFAGEGTKLAASAAPTGLAGRHAAASSRPSTC